MLSIAQQLFAAAASRPYVPPREDVGPDNTRRQTQCGIDALTALKDRQLTRTELGAALGINPSCVSRRVRLLKERLLVDDCRDKSGRYVRITKAGLSWLKDNPCA